MSRWTYVFVFILATLLVPASGTADLEENGELGPSHWPSGVELAQGPVLWPSGVELAQGPVLWPSGVELAQGPVLWPSGSELVVA